MSPLRLPKRPGRRTRREVWTVREPLTIPSDRRDALAHHFQSARQIWQGEYLAYRHHTSGRSRFVFDRVRRVDSLWLDVDGRLGTEAPYVPVGWIGLRVFVDVVDWPTDGVAA